jgi:hypothetical protein
MEIGRKVPEKPFIDGHTKFLNRFTVRKRTSKAVSPFSDGPLGRLVTDGLPAAQGILA